MENHRRKGQTSLEYVLVFLALLVVSSALVFLVRAAGRSSERTTTFICSEYP